MLIWIFRYYQYYTETGGDEDEGGCTAGCCGEIAYGDYDSDEEEDSEEDLYGSEEDEEVINAFLSRKNVNWQQLLKIVTFGTCLGLVWLQNKDWVALC